MRRVQVYDAAHKGLRNALSQLQFLCGKTNFERTTEVQKLFDLSREVFSLFKIHARDENEVTLVELEARSPGAADRDRRFHDRLAAERRSIEDFMTTIYTDANLGRSVADMGAELFLLLTKYHADCLLHIVEEETITQLELWRFFTDEELIKQRFTILERNPPDILLTWIKFIIPAQNLAERVRFLGPLRKAVSTPLLNHAIKLIRLEIPEDEFQALSRELCT
jgi:hypothetical protein